MNVLKSFSKEILEKWMQWITVFLYMNFLLTGALAGWLVWLVLVVYSPFLRYPLLVYVAWIYYDRNSGGLGERRCEWVRNWKIWKYHNEFFPAKLHKTAELSPEKNYIFCVFPHGVLSIGAFCAFGNDYGGFSKVFPGLKSYIITLGQHFITPFIREYSMAIGALPSSADCLNYFLGTKKGVALALIVGGAHEALFSKPGVYKINLSKRKGFIKIALKNGASLVPTISFGEVDIYDQVHFAEGSFGRKAQFFIKNTLGIAPAIFHGQFFVVPYRKPINVVVGKPIEIEQIKEPTQEQLDATHSKFVEALTHLFESEKRKYIENAENTHLTIL